MERTQDRDREEIPFRAWRELKEEALGENLREIRRLTGEREPSGREIRILAVVKANAYGHGDVETARILQKEGIRDFAVATLEEGLRLRENQIGGKILILGYTPPVLLEKAKEYNLMQTVVDPDYGKQIVRHVPGLFVHLKVNTGMNRLGVNWQDREVVCEILREKSLHVQGIFSHLNMADGKSIAEQEHTKEQIRRFTGLLDYLEQEGLCPPDRHLASSYGIQMGPLRGCNLVRPGIFLYGVHSSRDASEQSLERNAGDHTFSGTPALSIKARVALVRQIGPGEAVSYGPEFRAKAPMRLAVLAIGYADGIPRGLKGGAVLLHGKRAPIVGRICMDQMVVDTTGIPDVMPGDVATVLGQDKTMEIRAEDLARQAGTITNELLGRLGERLPVVVRRQRAQKMAGEPG